MPLDEEDGDEEITCPYLSKADFFNDANIAQLAKQESYDLRSPSPQNLQQITSLLDDDEDCFCSSNLHSLTMARQKSKTEYNKRANIRKESLVSAIQEADPMAEDGSVTNSQSIFQVRVSEESQLLLQTTQSPHVKQLSDGEGLSYPSPDYPV